MRICFFSDVHGNAYALRAFLRDLEQRRSVDLMVFGGDFFGYFYDVDEVITELRLRNVHCLLGNHDKMFLNLLEGKLVASELCNRYGSTYCGIEKKISEENISFLYSLKSVYRVEVDKLRIVFVHGSITDPLNGRIYPDTEVIDSEEYQGLDVVFMGHTHYKMQRSIGKCQLINPGSVGQPRDGKGTSYVIYDTRERKCEFCVFSYDYKNLLNDIEVRDAENKAMVEKLKELVVRVR